MAKDEIKKIKNTDMVISICWTLLAFLTLTWQQLPVTPGAVPVSMWSRHGGMRGPRRTACPLLLDGSCPGDVPDNKKCVSNSALFLNNINLKSPYTVDSLIAAAVAALHRVAPFDAEISPDSNPCCRFSGPFHTELARGK